MCRTRGSIVFPLPWCKPVVTLRNAAVNFHEPQRSCSSRAAQGELTQTSQSVRRAPKTIHYHRELLHCMGMRKEIPGRQPGSLIPGCPWESCYCVGLWEREKEGGWA